MIKTKHLHCLQGIDVFCLVDFLNMQVFITIIGPYLKIWCCPMKTWVSMFFYNHEDLAMSGVAPSYKQ